jgi:Uma2 family endonuclease
MAEVAYEIVKVSAEDYLAAEHEGGWRQEFVNGTVYAMVGSSDRHNLISLNLALALSVALPDRCQVFTADMKLHIRSGRDERFYYPDVFVSCSPADRERYTRSEPVFVAEVLSPTTERVDRTEKFEAYKTIASLEEYALVAQDEVRLELFRRRTGWQHEVFGPDDTLALDSLNLSLPLASLYRRTDLS